MTCAHHYWQLVGCMCLLWRQTNRGHLWGNRGTNREGRKGQDRREDKKLKGVEKSVKGNTVV